MSKKRKKQPVVMPAGQRRDATRQDNNASETNRDNLIEEIQWRKEHRQ